MIKLIATILTFVWLGWVVPAYAQESGGGEAGTGEDAVAEGPQYVSLGSSIVVNFMSESARINYLKVDVEVYVKDAEAAKAVTYHLPYLRNTLVLLFSTESEEKLNSVVGKEALRKTALAEVQKALSAQTGLPVVEDLVFTSFVVQG